MECLVPVSRFPVLYVRSAAPGAAPSKSVPPITRPTSCHSHLLWHLKSCAPLWNWWHVATGVIFTWPPGPATPGTYLRDMLHPLPAGRGRIPPPALQEAIHPVRIEPGCGERLPRGRWLEIFCSTGEQIPFFRTMAEDYTGVDPSFRIEQARSRFPAARFIRGYFPQAVPGEWFDVVGAQFLLELTANPEQD